MIFAPIKGFESRNVRFSSIMLVFGIGLIGANAVGAKMQMWSADLQVAGLAAVLVLVMIWALIREVRNTQLNQSIHQDTRIQFENLARAKAAVRKDHDVATAIKTNLVDNMSHEIRTPMNGVLGLSLIHI